MERQLSRTFSELPRAGRSLGTAVWRAFAQPLPRSLPAHSRFKGRGRRVPRRLQFAAIGCALFATLDSPTTAPAGLPQMGDSLAPAATHN